MGVCHSAIAEVDAVLHSAPLEVGFAPTCWLSMTDAEHLKKPGVLDVELMRTIQLMNTFFNMCNILLARLTMANAEQHKMFSRTQFGGRKFHMAITAVCILVNFLDYLHFRYQAGVVTPEDQAKCYDYFAHPWPLAQRSMGFPDQPLQMMVEVLQLAKHFISTPFGHSTDSYGGQDLIDQGSLPLGGAGQGNGDGPCFYSCTVDKSNKVCELRGAGALVVAPMTQGLLNLQTVKFVDDNTTLTSCTCIEAPAKQVMAKAQRELDDWQACSKVSGGTLNHAKNCHLGAGTSLE